ncbi:hypothetical protein [Variovorax sp.]|uniref:hypothetical protein n=1 Tax=Variovorax sp. TaxID=1871043 RepID=UPI003BAA7A59
MSERELSDFATKTAYYYSIRLLIKNTNIPVSEITAVLGMEPDYSWNAGEGGHGDTMWGHVSWTEGQRLFFDEVGEILGWLEGRKDFVSRLLSSGGELHVIVQLPGVLNIGSDLMPEPMLLASRLGVRIGIEVLPDLQRPK